ncbi:hypothetical protein FRC04_004121 [Tulasnella sp. 424]|nr:hypothetical protein FRC04_004121 [Tulasnella sp. 424]
MASHGRLTKRKSHGKRAREPEQRVAPDYVIKADDSSFIMLAELGGRLRVEWADALADSMVKGIPLFSGATLSSLDSWRGTLQSVVGVSVIHCEDHAPASHHDPRCRGQLSGRPSGSSFTPRLIKSAGGVSTAGFMITRERERSTATASYHQEHYIDQDQLELFDFSSRVAAFRSWTRHSLGFDFVGNVYGKDETSTIPVPGETGPWTWDPDRWQPGPPSPAATPLRPSSPFLSRTTVSDFGNRYTFPLSNLTIPALRAWGNRETYEQRSTPSTLRSRGVHDPSAPIKPPSVEEDEDEEPQTSDTPASTRIFVARGPSWNGYERMINPAEPKSAEGAKTVISNTQSFKRKRVEAPTEDDSATSEEHAIPLEDDGLVHPGVDQAP